MSFPRMKKWQWALFVCAITVLLLPVGLAIAAPALAPLPTPASFTAEAVPPLPERQEPLPGFQDLLDPLPLIVRDLPDAASQDVVAAYDNAALFDRQVAREMFVAAERAIPVPAASESAWNNWLGTLDDNRYDFTPIPASVLQNLRNDPRNGDRLSNFAVALFFIAEPQSEWEGLHDGPRASKARALFDLLVQEFPDSRGVVLNAAYLNTTMATPERILVLRSYLDAWSTEHPNDATALQLLAPLTVRFGQPEQWEQVESRLRQLATSSNATYSAFGPAMLGDMLQGLARTQLPFSAQQTARQALAEYDEALALSDDPSVYAARASVLQFLGNGAAAIATLQEAVRIHPDSVPLRLQLAELHLVQDGEIEERQEALIEAQAISKEALERSLGQADPLLIETQLLEHGRQRDQGTAAYAWSRPHRTYYFNSPPMAGGGIIVSYELIQRFDQMSSSGVGSPYGSLPLSRAIDDLVTASVALGDPEGLEVGIATIQQHLDDWSGSQYEFTLLEQALGTLQQNHMVAARLVADPNMPAEIDQASGNELGFSTAVRALRTTGLFDQAASLCRSHEDWTCEAENSYLAGNIAAAHQAFAKVEKESSQGESVGLDPLLGLRIGMVAELAGDVDKATRLYELAVEKAPIEAYPAKDIATVRLANVKLDAGDVDGAIELYDQIIEHLDGTALASTQLLLQRTRNNRGIAQLMTQMHSGAQIDCEGNAEAICDSALADFDAALVADPHDPISLLGKGWVERLQGDSPASIQTLERAVELDPTLFPGLNDLGVLAAQSGNSTGARRYFEAALAANPKYDLALWNLGVLEMQRGVSGLLRGQAYLARANLQNPSFVSSDLSYRFDDNVYRVEFTERSRPGAGWSFGSASSLAATTLGLVTVVTLLLGALKYAGSNKLQDGINQWTHTAVEWEERTFGRKLSLPTGSGWHRWLPLLITLPILAFVTSWPALRTNPASAAATVTLALFAALVAVIAHELGHILVAWRVKAEVRPAQWGPGSLLALLLLPVNLSAGPFPGEQIQCKDERSAWLVHLGGPVANLLVAVGVYAVYLLQPMPGLRLIVLAQLAAVGYALLPFEPLDGAALSRYRPKVLAGLAFFVLVAGALFSLNVF